MMRSEGEEREINHHGKTITVGGDGGSEESLATEDGMIDQVNSLL